MKLADKILFRVFFWGLPIIILLGIWTSTIEGPNDSSAYNAAGLILIFWTVVSMIFCIRLTTSEAIREFVLKKLVRLRERDERESMLTGIATKKVFFAILGILIFLVFLSSIQISLHRVSQEKAVNGKTGTISLGFNLDLFEKSKLEKNLVGEKNYFHFKGIPLTNQGILLLLIIFQLLFYQLHIKRLIKE